MAASIMVLIECWRSRSISYPMLERPLAMAAAAVVPVPRNGSSTVSPISECIWISR